MAYNFLKENCGLLHLSPIFKALVVFAEISECSEMKDLVSVCC